MFRTEPSGEKFQALNLNSGRAMEFTEIYAASVRDTMRQARRRLACREALTALDA